MTKAMRRLIADAMNAVEVFVNLAMIATGLLQVLAIEHAEVIRHRHQLRMRTYSSVIPSEEMVKTVIQHEFYHHFRKFKYTAIYRIIRATSVTHPQPSNYGRLLDPCRTFDSQVVQKRYHIQNYTILIIATPASRIEQPKLWD
jgi:hypothetical protein